LQEWTEDEEDEQCITAEDVQLGVTQDVQVRRALWRQAVR
jgi:hypothetical protein